MLHAFIRSVGRAGSGSNRSIVPLAGTFGPESAAGRGASHRRLVRPSRRPQPARRSQRTVTGTTQDPGRRCPLRRTRPVPAATVSRGKPAHRRREEPAARTAGTPGRSLGSRTGRFPAPVPTLPLQHARTAERPCRLLAWVQARCRAASARRLTPRSKFRAVTASPPERVSSLSSRISRGAIHASDSRPIRRGTAPTSHPAPPSACPGLRDLRAQPGRAVLDPRLV